MVALTTNERVAAWRARNPEKARAQTRTASRVYRTKTSTEKPFIGIDGEGAGQDLAGRQNYLYIHASGGRVDRHCFDSNRRLSTAALLDFILELPANAILVGYFFTYDATQILRDLPQHRLQRLFADKDPNNKQSSYTYWGRYAIQFIPRQYFRVALVEKFGDGERIVPGSARTINEVGGFFQKSFVEALKQWEICDQQTLDIIGAQKERRSEFVEMTNVEREYCRLECKLLAQLMTKLREVCKETDCLPASWRGAGSLAAALYRNHSAPTRKTRAPRSDALQNFTSAAYYGGRFEITQLGHIPGPIYEYDINSAYPAGMLKLPCPFHTRWRKSRGICDAELYCADISFSHDDDCVLCSFPIRDKGRLYWPKIGGGIYWSPEIIQAIKNDAKIDEARTAYYATTKCNCTPYDWVRELYEYRKSIGKATKGFAIKLGINALYGKLAQRLGGAPYKDMIGAGLITSFCRAQLMGAYHGKEKHIVMLATDGVFSRVPLEVDIGSSLGQWESKLRSDGMFIVQPGIYWSSNYTIDDLLKTRGIPQSRIIKRSADFESVFNSWVNGDGGNDPPSLSVTIPTFIAHRLALARNKPELAGCWIQQNKNISFDWGNKREKAGQAIKGLIRTVPYQGWADLRSQIYDPSIMTDLQEQLLNSEGAPDYEPWGNSGE